MGISRLTQKIRHEDALPAEEAAELEHRLELVRAAVREAPEPESAPVTADDVAALREDPELAEVADIAERYSEA